MFKRLLGVFAMVLGLGAAANGEAADAPPKLDPENTLVLTLTTGKVVIQLLPDLAPKTVARIKELAHKHFYDGLTFHRVIDGFMVQTGDPKGDGTGGSGVNLPAEFSAERHVRGIVSMARSSSPNSADSQFFIMLGDAPSLNGNYTVFGRVVSGMEHVDQIKKGDSARNGKVDNPDKIVTLRVGGDA